MIPIECSGYLVEAIRQGCELRYPDEEPGMLTAIWEMPREEGSDRYHRAGPELLEAGYDLFETSKDPSAWSQRLRSVVRFMVCQNIDPEQVCPPVAQTSDGR